MPSIDASPFVLIVGSILLVLVAGFCIAAPASQRMRWWPFALVVAAATLAPQVTTAGAWIPPPPPLDSVVLYGQQITAVILAITIIGLGVQFTRIGHLHVPRASIAFLAIHLILCFRQLIVGEYAEAAPRLGVYLIVFIFGGILMPSLIDSVLSARRLVAAFAAAALLFLLAQLLVMLVDYDAGFVQDRWFGLTANANHAGMIVALLLPATVGLALMPSLLKVQRVGCLVLSGGLVVILLLTGSRGAAVTAAVAMLLLFRRRLGQSILVLLPLALLVTAFLAWGGYESDQFERLTSTANTREGVILLMLEEWGESPIFGSAERWGVRENAYLGVLVRTGIIGGIIMLLSGIVIIGQMISVAWRQRNLGPDSALADIAIAGLGAVVINSVFEATFFSNFNQTIFIVYGYVAVLDVCYRRNLPYLTSHVAPPPLMSSYS